MKALAATLVLMLAAAFGPAQAQNTAGRPSIIEEARGFMDSYAADLRAGDREAVIARYDPAGMWFVTHGRVDPTSHAAVADLYRRQWTPPAAFDWNDLAYVPSGPDAVSVIGRFIWTAEDGETVTLAYHALLVRVDGQLRIRIEDETPVPAGNGS